MILVILEHNEGIIKKTALEATSFAANLASITNSDLSAVILKGAQHLDELGKYGINDVYEVENAGHVESLQWVDLISKVVSELKPNYIILSNNSLGKSIGGTLSVKLNIGLISNAVDISMDQSKLCFKKTVFSGKAFAWYALPSNNGIISVMPNGYGLRADKNNMVNCKNLNLSLIAPKIKLLEKNLVKGKTPLTEADIVVSAGRGLKEAQNWSMIEELAELLNAATACSRPVADAGWRPHHEHVGQTGIAIRPKVYFAIGISGAIQHLAGVNNSKTIIVINKDPEAPFFKAADYGVCGDLFEIIPRLNEAIKKLK